MNEEILSIETAKKLAGLEITINKAINNILKDISMIKSVPMSKQEIIQRLEETLKILKEKKNEINTM